MQELYYPSIDLKHSVHCCVWHPEGKARAVVQIIHGMEEYAARYAPFAERLAQQGFLVCAEDHLGHGKTVPEDELGTFPVDHGEREILKDIYDLTLYSREVAPGAPLFILGHSMGSFFCRSYLAEHGSEVKGAIIMGTGWQSRALMDVAIDVTKLIGSAKGYGYKSKFISDLAFGSYNKKFAPQRTPYDWLSADPQNVDNYIADGLCGFGFACSGYLGLFRIIRRACSARTIKATPKDLPIYFVSGDMDPVGNYGKGVKKACSKYKKYGVKDVRITLYEGARHEILNDVCKQQAGDDIISFINGILS